MLGVDDRSNLRRKKILFGRAARHKIFSCVGVHTCPGQPIHILCAFFRKPYVPTLQLTYTHSPDPAAQICTSVLLYRWKKKGGGGRDDNRELHCLSVNSECSYCTKRPHTSRCRISRPAQGVNVTSDLYSLGLLSTWLQQHMIWSVVRQQWLWFYSFWYLFKIGTKVLWFPFTSQRHTAFCNNVTMHQITVQFLYYPHCDCS